MTDRPAGTATPDPQVLGIIDAIRGEDFAGALTAAEQALATSKDQAPLLSLAGLAAQRMGEPERAIPHLRALMRLHPEDAANRSNLARALIAVGEPDEALGIAQGGESASLSRIEGFLLQEKGDRAGAIAAYRRALVSEPDDAATLNNLGNALGDLGEFDQAIDALELAITAAPQQVELYLNLADVLRKADRSGPRLKVMRDAAALAPDDRVVLTELALAEAHDDHFDAAFARLQDICRRFPTFGESHLELGRMYESYNRIDDLAELIESIDRSTAPPESRFLDAWLAQRRGRFDEAAAHAAAIPESIDPMRRFHLIGSIDERRGNSAAAFAAFERMNRETIMAPASPNRDSYRQSIERRLAQWTPEWAEDWQQRSPAQDGYRDPIFLVGFPRSGTTLLDTLLMGLPALCVLEERPMVARISEVLAQSQLPALPERSIAQLRADYFRIAGEFGWDSNRWLVDKQPLNMTHVAVIHRLFPNARVILAERHPYDVVLSCFMANFQPNFAMRSFTDLTEAARTYDTVFSAWETATSLLGIPYRTVRYERLVADPEAELRPIVEWLGLEWDDSVLDHTATAGKRGRVRTASYAQIGEPLYTRARDRWRRYEEELAPVMPVLRPWVQGLGYETE